MMTRPLSIYLDLLRGTAALLVLFYHASNDQFGGRWLQRGFAHAGTPGVIIFFVLSGFVIAWVAATREKAFDVFMVNRLARLWSVAIPALALTLVADWIGYTIDPAIYSDIPNWADLIAHPLTHLVAAAGFLNQIWFLDVRPLSNNPFWSLSYEWWYYTAFGCFMLLPGRLALIFGAAALMVMGPKIWLLFPVWLMGVQVYRWTESGLRLSTPLAIGLFLAPIGVFGVLALDRMLGLREHLIDTFGAQHLGFSIIFVVATLFGALVSCNLYAFHALELYLAPALTGIERPVRRVAGATLSIYLYHYPLLYLFGAILHVQSASPFWINLAIVACTLGCCFAFSAVTESKKNVLRNWLQMPLPLLRSFHAVPPQRI